MSEHIEREPITRDLTRDERRAILDLFYTDENARVLAAHGLDLDQLQFPETVVIGYKLPQTARRVLEEAVASV